jgi:hypothetical protein
MGMYNFFKDFQILTKNPKILACGFTEKCLFMTKTDRNSVFLSREVHIPDRLYIIVMCINFYEFLKNTNFGSKSKGVNLQFYGKSQVCDKN